MITLSGAVALMMGNAGGRAATAGEGNTGAPGENGNTCISCHNGGAYGPIITLLEAMQGGQLVARYVPGRTYDFKLTVAAGQGNPAGYGFQLTALDGNDVNVGTFKNLGANVKESAANKVGNRKYLEHKGGASNTRVFTMKWTAPAAKTGAVDFYYVGNVVNGNGAKTLDNGGLGSSITLIEQQPFGLPYFEPFELDLDGWMSWSDTGGGSWTLGGPPLATVGEPTAWGVEGAVGAGLAFLETPPIDLSAALDDPVISFGINYDTEPGVGGWLELSTDEGASWDKLGTTGDGLGWYDAGDPTWGDVWTGETGGWSYSELQMPGAAGEDGVRLRFVFTAGAGSSSSVFGIDDLLIDFAISDPPGGDDGGSTGGDDGYGTTGEHGTSGDSWGESDDGSLGSGTGGPDLGGGIVP